MQIGIGLELTLPRWSGDSLASQVAALFAAGMKGIWRESSRAGTLYTASVDAKPVELSGNSIGFVRSLDQGSDVGPELVANGNFSSGLTGWTATAGATLAVNAGRLEVTSTGGAPAGSTPLATLVGRWYRLTLSMTKGTAPNGQGVRVGSGPGVLDAMSALVSATGSYVFFFKAVSTTSYVSVGYGETANGQTSYWDDFSAVLLPGNHQVQATAGLKPAYQVGPPRPVFDGADDVLNTTFAAALGANCTVGRYVPGTGVVIATGQNIGTSFADSVTSGPLLIADRALTAGETTLWTNYLTQQGTLPIPLAALEHVIVLGASHEVGAFGEPINGRGAEVLAAEARILAATGRAVTVHQYAVAGTNTYYMKDVAMPAMFAAQGSLPGGGKTLVVIGIGGNDVTPNRPFTLPSTVLNTCKADLLAAIANIEAKGWDWCLFDLTWRDYDAPLCRSDRSKGSWPWVTEVSRAINAARAKVWGRGWTYADGASWCDTYSLIRNNRQFLAFPDPIHLSDYTPFRDFIVDTAIVPAIKGVPAAQIFPRDEAYALGYSLGTVIPTGTDLAVPTTATHQGVAHVGVYAAGSTPSAAEVVAGTGTGFITKTSAERNGATIDLPVALTVGGLVANTTYRVCAVFVSDAAQTSAVQSANATTGAGSPDVAILFRNTAPNARPNANQLIGASNPGGVVLSNAVDVNGAATTIGLTAAANAIPISANSLGNAALSVPPYLLAGDLTDAWYVTAETRQFSLTGLNPAKTYRVAFAASRAVASTDLTRLTDIAIVGGTIADGGAATRGYSASDPASGTTAGNVVFEITPTAGGVITFDFKRSASNNTGFAYLGGIYLKPL